MQKNKKKVYVGLSADIIHEGHINILKTANKYGDVIVGLLTDEAIASYKNIPHLDFKRRKIIVQNIRYVKKVIPQKTLDYVENLNLIKFHENSYSRSHFHLGIDKSFASPDAKGTILTPMNMNVATTLPYGM